MLKDYSAKKETLTLGPVNINKVVENAILLMNYKIKKTTSRFDVVYGRGLPLLMADQQKLEQVFVNLISNGLESLPDKDRGAFVETSYHGIKRQVIVEVRDEGVGVPVGNLSRILDPFFTTKRSVGGTGLGLSIVNRIVNLHNGKIVIKSREGEGSTFRVVLPVSRPAGTKNKPKTMQGLNRDC